MKTAVSLETRVSYIIKASYGKAVFWRQNAVSKVSMKNKKAIVKTPPLQERWGFFIHQSKQ